MNAVEKSLSFLTQILQSLGMTVQGNAIVIEGEDGPAEVVVGDKVLVMPTPEVLKASRWEEVVAFWPLCENTLRGESEVQQELLTMVRGAVNIRLAAMLWNLVKVANSKECKENKLSPEQAVFLPCLPGLDPEMVKRLGKLVLGVNPDEYKTSLIHMNLKRRTKINGVQFDRACLVRFPLAEMERKEKPYGADLRVKDMDALTNLLDYILPEWQVENAYSRGTDSKVAPYFVATMLAYQNLNARISELAKLFVDLFPIFGTLINEDDWVTSMDDLLRMRDSMPSLPGSEGIMARGSNEAPQIATPQPARGVQPAPGQVMPWDEQPVPSPVDNAGRGAQRVVEDEAVEYVPRQQQPALGQIPQNVQGYHQPQPAGQIPNGYGQPQQPNGGLTFAQIQAQRQQQMYGTGYATVNQAPEVGGSPYSAAAPVNGVSNNQGGYNVSYVNPQNNYQHPNPGRGF